MAITKNLQYYKFSAYGFLKNLRFFDAFFILFLVDAGMTYSQIGILYAVREIIINIFEIPSGIIADTFGRKTSLIASFIIYILSFAVFYFTKDFWFFMLGFSLYGMADAFRSGTHKGMMMDYLKSKSWANQKILYYGYTRSWSQKGSAISSLLAGILVFYTGEYQNIFLYSMIPYLINLFLIISYPKDLNYPMNKKKTKPKVKMNTLSLIQTIKQPKVLMLINTSALFSAYLKAVKDYIQPLMVNLALMIPVLMYVDVDKKNGLLIGVFYFIIYIITSRASQLASKMASKALRNIPYLTLVLGFFAGIACGVFYFYEMWILSMLFFVIVYIIENLRKPILTGYVTDHVPGEILTSVLSVQSLLKTAITAILALVFGVLADMFGIGISFIGVSLSLVIISGIVNIISTHKQQETTSLK